MSQNSGKPKTQDRIPVTAYLSPELMEDLDQLQAHLGISRAATIEWYLREAALRYKQDNTKEQSLARLEDAVAHLTRKVDMMLFLLWSQIEGATVKVLPEDIQRIAVIVAQLEELSPQPTLTSN
jgi:hypothetical protein